MSYQHKELAASRWKEMSFIVQMANIGSEVERALNWKARNNEPYAQLAFERALELIDLTLGSVKGLPRLKELARVRESFADYFFGENQYGSTEASWRNYFSSFAYAARKDS